MSQNRSSMSSEISPCLSTSKWSTYPATNTVDIDCYDITGTSQISFCESGVSLTPDPLDGSIVVSGATVFAAPPTSADPPVGPTDLINKAYTDSLISVWSTIPVSGDVDMACYSLKNVEAIDMCGGTSVYNNTSTSSTDISNNERSISVSSKNTSIVMNRTTNYGTLSSSTVVSSQPTTFAPTQLITKNYVDTILIPYLKLAAGYHPTIPMCFNIKPTTGLVDVSIAVLANRLFIVFLYPFIKTLVTKFVFYTGSTLGTIPSTFSLSLFDFGAAITTSYNLSSNVICVARTNDLTPSDITWAPNTRYEIPMSATGYYTLQPGKKYGIAIYRGANNPTVMNLLGINQTSGQYSFGFYNNIVGNGRSDLQSTALTLANIFSTPNIGALISLTTSNFVSSIPCMGLI